MLLWTARAVWLAGSLQVAPAGPRLPQANVADACQWPTVVSFRVGDDKCTGTLVHPEIVVTATHCLLHGRPAGMRFGESFWPQTRSVEVVECFTRSEYESGADPAEDIAACRLAEPVDEVPLTPLLGACESAESVVPGADVVLVGFGIPSTVGDFGTKRYAFTRVVEAPRDDGTFVAGDGVVGGCHGDSGGPALVRRPDGTWHVAGVLVYGPECGAGPSRYLAPSRHLAWLQSVTGVDLSPCRDADGAWAPGAQCRAATDPQAIADAWDAWCEGPAEVPDGACEAAAGSTGDEPPPDAATTAVRGEGEETSSGDAMPSEPPTSSEGCRVGGPTRRATWTIAWAVSWVLGVRRRGTRRVETRA